MRFDTCSDTSCTAGRSSKPAEWRRDRLAAQPTGGGGAGARADADASMGLPLEFYSQKANV